MERAYYASSIEKFCEEPPELIGGILAQNSQYDVLLTQRDTWLEQIRLLKNQLGNVDGYLLFEFDIPRMGRRIDVVLIVKHIVFVIEFKVGSDAYERRDLDQVVDYVLDLKNFHEASHSAVLVPILIATHAESEAFQFFFSDDRICHPICSDGQNLAEVIAGALMTTTGDELDPSKWLMSKYKPTPTIIEATLALYNEHDVTEISRSDAGAINLSQTSFCIDQIIQKTRANHEKALVLVTGVPGAGKTLVGLNVATKHSDPEDDCYCVFLSGNQPLVSILQEALARDKVRRTTERGENLRIGEARSEVKALIQNVHHFRDAYVIDKTAPNDHIALFDEAQRAWNLQQTATFMEQKKNIPSFNFSEPEFLISCMNRHDDWAVVVCLVGGGQEINKGEAGVVGWLDALETSFPDWKVYSSPELTDSEYGDADEKIKRFEQMGAATYQPELHLKSSMRSFRSSAVSLLVKQILDIDQKAKQTLHHVTKTYPIAITRDIDSARKWLKEHARGSERYGIVVSSQAERLKSVGLHVKAPVNPVNWFLDGKDSVKSSYYLEDVATEFHVQGLELDWSCVVWDADLRFCDGEWANWAFRGNKWQRIRKEERQKYQINAYRVLLTRARQGMVLVVPEGSDTDATRPREYYDRTYEYLAGIGLEEIG